GGGGGVGDPLRRDPLAVVADLREDRITAAAAAQAYGVEGDAAGEFLSGVTAALRRRLRGERLHAANAAPPSREVEESGDPAVAVVETHAGWRRARWRPHVDETGAGWLCAACGQQLTERDEDWREAAVRWTTSVATALRARGQMVRECS